MVHERGREDRGGSDAGNDKACELGKDVRLAQIPMAFNRESRQAVRVSEVVEYCARKMKLHGIARMSDLRGNCPGSVDTGVFGSVDLGISRNIQQPPLLHADRVEVDRDDQPWQMNVVNRSICRSGVRQ